MGGHKCHYKSEWEKDFPFVKKSSKGELYFYCSWCRCDLQCSNGGRTDVDKHSKTQGHKQSERDVHKSNLRAFTNFTPQNSSSNPVTAAELTLAYHCVKHHQSYKSAGCLVQVLKVVLKDSKICDEISFGETKVAALVQNVLAPASVEFVLKKMQKCEAFFSVSSDATSKRGHRFYPVVLKFFDPEEGIRNCLLDFYEDADETSEAIYNKITKTIQDAGLKVEKISSYSADNANVNFGVRSGVHKRLTEDNENVKKANCLAHLLHNASDAAVGSLKYDVVTFVTRTYGHFSQSPARVKELKSFFEFMDCEWTPLLKHVSTRFLSLLPAIDRILLNWDALRSYFCSIEDEDDVPPLLRKFFSYGEDEDDSIQKYYVYFLSHVLKVIQEVILKFEAHDITVTTVYDDMVSLMDKFEARITSKFFGAQMGVKLRKLSAAQKQKHEADLLNVYQVFVKYVRKRYDFSDKNFHKLLRCLSLKGDITFEEVKLACDHLKLCYNEDKLFDEFVVLKKFGESSEIRSDPSVVNKYVTFFTGPGKPCSELLKLLSFILSINVSNAQAERVFSFMGFVWTNDRNRLEVESVCAELQICINYQGKLCPGMYAEFFKNKQLLQAAKSKEKYPHHQKTNESDSK